MLRGMHVTVVHLGEWLLERQLDKTNGQLLETRWKAGQPGISPVRNRPRPPTPAMAGVGSVQFKNGDIIPADLVVMAAGIRQYRTRGKSGIPCSRGILVNDTMQTYDPHLRDR